MDYEALRTPKVPVDGSRLFDRYNIDGDDHLSLEEVSILIQDALILRDRLSDYPEVATARALMTNALRARGLNNIEYFNRQVFIDAIDNGFLQDDKELSPRLLIKLYDLGGDISKNNSNSLSISEEYSTDSLDLVKSRQEERGRILQIFKKNQFIKSAAQLFHSRKRIKLGSGEHSSLSSTSSSISADGALTRSLDDSASNALSSSGTINTAACTFPFCENVCDLKDMYGPSSHCILPKYCKCNLSNICLSCLKSAVKFDIQNGRNPTCPGSVIEDKSRCKGSLDKSLMNVFFKNECPLCANDEEEKTSLASATDSRNHCDGSDLVTVDCAFFHTFCKPCLKENTAKSIIYKSMPKCPRFSECKYVFELKDIKKNLDVNENSDEDEFVQKWHDICLYRANSNNSKKKIPCPGVNCDGFLTVDLNNENPKSKCTNCHKNFCLVCKNLYHYNCSCIEAENIKSQWVSLLHTLSTDNDNGEAARALQNIQNILLDNQYFKDLVMRNQLKLCPNCNIRLEKVVGCSSVTCGQDAADKGGRDYKQGCHQKFNWDDIPSPSLDMFLVKSKSKIDLNLTDPQIDESTFSAFQSAKVLRCTECRRKLQGIRFDCINCPNNTKVSLCLSCLSKHISIDSGTKHAGHLFKVIEPLKQLPPPEMCKCEILPSGEIRYYRSKSYNPSMSSDTTMVKVEVHPDGNIVMADGFGRAVKLLSLETISFPIPSRLGRAIIVDVKHPYSAAGENLVPISQSTGALTVLSGAISLGVNGYSDEWKNCSNGHPLSLSNFKKSKAIETWICNRCNTNTFHSVEPRQYCISCDYNCCTACYGPEKIISSRSSDSNSSSLASTSSAAPDTLNDDGGMSVEVLRSIGVPEAEIQANLNINMNRNFGALLGGFGSAGPLGAPLGGIGIGNAPLGGFGSAGPLGAQLSGIGIGNAPLGGFGSAGPLGAQLSGFGSAPLGGFGGAYIAPGVVANPSPSPARQSPQISNGLVKGEILNLNNVMFKSAAKAGSPFPLSFGSLGNTKTESILTSSASWYGPNHDAIEILTAIGMPKAAAESFFKECGNDINLATKKLAQNTKEDYYASSGLLAYGIYKNLQMKNETVYKSIYESYVTSSISINVASVQNIDDKKCATDRNFTTTINIDGGTLAFRDFLCAKQSTATALLTYCNQGHGCEISSNSRGFATWVCDICRIGGNPSVIARWVCQACNFDACFACRPYNEGGTQQTSSTSTVSLYSNKDGSGRQKWNFVKVDEIEGEDIYNICLETDNTDLLLFENKYLSVDRASDANSLSHGNSTAGGGRPNVGGFGGGFGGGGLSGTNVGGFGGGFGGGGLSGTNIRKPNLSVCLSSRDDGSGDQRWIISRGYNLFAESNNIFYISNYGELLRATEKVGNSIPNLGELIASASEIGRLKSDSAGQLCVVIQENTQSQTGFVNNNGLIQGYTPQKDLNDKWNLQSSCKLKIKDNQAFKVGTYFLSGDMVHLYGQLKILNMRQSLGVLPAEASPKNTVFFSVLCESISREGVKNCYFCSVSVKPNGEITLDDQHRHSDIILHLDGIRFRVKSATAIDLILPENVLKISPSDLLGRDSISNRPEQQFARQERNDRLFPKISFDDFECETACAFIDKETEVCFLFGEVYKNYTEPILDPDTHDAIDGLPSEYSGGSWNPGDIIAVLPAEYRPSSVHTFFCFASKAPDWPDTGEGIASAVGDQDPPQFDQWGYPIPRSQIPNRHNGNNGGTNFPNLQQQYLNNVNSFGNGKPSAVVQPEIVGFISDPEHRPSSIATFVAVINM